MCGLARTSGLPVGYTVRGFVIVSPLRYFPEKPPCQGRQAALSSAPFSARDMRTISAKANEVKRQWWLIDAADQVLGRVASKAANLLRGKEKAIFTPHVDTGDFVVVINAAKVRVTGKKETQKEYMSFSGYV